MVRSDRYITPTLRCRLRPTRSAVLSLRQISRRDMYAFLDIAFVVFHTGLVAFNLFGWISPKTRRVHLAAIGLTVLSWFGLGAVYGWGYCPCTDWHWDVKRRLGETDLPASYVKYYVDRVTGFSWDPAFIDVSVLVLGVGALFISVILNWRDWRRKRRG